MFEKWSKVSTYFIPILLGLILSPALGLVVGVIIGIVWAAQSKVGSAMAMWVTTGFSFPFIFGLNIYLWSVLA